MEHEALWGDEPGDTADGLQGKAQRSWSSGVASNWGVIVLLSEEVRGRLHPEGWIEVAMVSACPVHFPLLQASAWSRVHL